MFFAALSPRLSGVVGMTQAAVAMFGLQDMGSVSFGSLVKGLSCVSTFSCSIGLIGMLVLVLAAAVNQYIFTGLDFGSLPRNAYENWLFGVNKRFVLIFACNTYLEDPKALDIVTLKQQLRAWTTSMIVHSNWACNVLNLLQGIGMVFVLRSNLRDGTYALQPLGAFAVAVDGIMPAASFLLAVLGLLSSWALGPLRRFTEIEVDLPCSLPCVGRKIYFSMGALGMRCEVLYFALSAFTAMVAGVGVALSSLSAGLLELHIRANWQTLRGEVQPPLPLEEAVEKLQYAQATQTSTAVAMLVLYVAGMVLTTLNSLGVMGLLQRMDICARFVAGIVGMSMLGWGSLLAFKIPLLLWNTLPVALFGAVFGAANVFDFVQQSLHILPPDSLGLRTLRVAKVALSLSATGGVFGALLFRRGLPGLVSAEWEAHCEAFCFKDWASGQSYATQQDVLVAITPFGNALMLLMLAGVITLSAQKLLWDFKMSRHLRERLLEAQVNATIGPDRLHRTVAHQTKKLTDKHLRELKKKRAQEYSRIVSEDGSHDVHDHGVSLSSSSSEDEGPGSPRENPLSQPRFT